MMCWADGLALNDGADGLALACLIAAPSSTLPSARAMDDKSATQDDVGLVELPGSVSHIHLDGVTACTVRVLGGFRAFLCTLTW